MYGLHKIGEVAEKKSSQISHSPIGIGFEKLDRDVVDPALAYDRLQELGVKWVRIQSGWAKTEKVKGEYDFSWLDDIVENLLRRGLVPWLCLCYGNGLYNEEAAKIVGGVGCPPINSEEEKAAWACYVAAVTEHYRGKIKWYEVWNEPDGKWCWKHGPSGQEYGEFLIATAKAVIAGDSQAKVIGGSMCLTGLGWLSQMLETGAGEYIDALSVHAYTSDETNGLNRLKAIEALCHKYNSKIRIIQGETGAQSRSDGEGAMAGGAWTESNQAKFMARNVITDLINEVMFSSYFTCMDMPEVLHGDVNDRNSCLDYGYFGVLRAEFDEAGLFAGHYSLKTSFRTMQVISSIFCEDFSKTILPVEFVKLHSQKYRRDDDGHYGLIYEAFSKGENSAGMVYWKPTELLTTSYESSISLDVAGVDQVPHIVDMVTGITYGINEQQIEEIGQSCYRLKNIPLRDYPLMLTFGDFVHAKT